MSNMYLCLYVHDLTSLLDGDMLFIDLLAIHMVRSVKTSTIISYHPESTWCQTSAKHLHSLTRLVGECLLAIIFSKTKVPTFLFLAILRYALYAWDESFELLYKHVSELVCNPRRGRSNVAHQYSGVGGTARQSYRAHTEASHPRSASSTLPITPS